MMKKFLDKVKNYLANKNEDKQGSDNEKTIMPGNLKPRLEKIKKQFKDCSDFVIRDFELYYNKQRLKAAICYFDGLADKDGINETVLKPLMIEGREVEEVVDPHNPDQAYYAIKNHLLTYASVTEAKTYEEMLLHVLSGETALFIDGYPIALLIATRGWDKRGIGTPVTEQVVRGPHEAFIETMRTNTALIRRKIRSADLKMVSMQIGRYSQTDIVVSYIEGIADPDVVEEVKNRLKKIDIDAILESGYIEELIEDNPYSPMPQIEHSERPDKVAASLLEGRVAIITDGTPYVLIVPATFWSFLQSPEDYYERYYFGSFVRILRIASILVALLAPSVYIAITTFHQEMLPTPLLVSIAGQREGVPFPAVIEAFMLEIAFEILREAGVRLPQPVGQSVSIVGALIIGQAAVEAGLVSAAMVIVVALTGIASMTTAAYNLGISFRLLRFPIMIAAAIFGFYGIMLVLLLLLTHLCALRSFGTPYLSPIAPTHYEGWKDIAVRAPWWRMLRRPRTYQPQNANRQRSMRGDS